jgi:hypothetical protein
MLQPKPANAQDCVRILDKFEKKYFRDTTIFLNDTFHTLNKHSSQVAPITPEDAADWREAYDLLQEFNRLGGYRIEAIMGGIWFTRNHYRVFEGKKDYPWRLDVPLIDLVNVLPNFKGRAVQYQINAAEHIVVRSYVARKGLDRPGWTKMPRKFNQAPGIEEQVARLTFDDIPEKYQLGAKVSITSTGIDQITIAPVSEMVWESSIMMPQEGIKVYERCGLWEVTIKINSFEFADELRAFLENVDFYDFYKGNAYGCLFGVKAVDGYLAIGTVLKNPDLEVSIYRGDIGTLKEDTIKLTFVCNTIFAPQSSLRIAVEDNLIKIYGEKQ